MNLVGKIFIVLIFVMSLVFMAFSMAVYATHRNWREVVVGKPKGGYSPNWTTPTSNWKNRETITTS